MKKTTVREVPGLLIASKGEWLVNIGLVAWHKGPISLAKARRELRADGRKVNRIGEREFVRLLPEEVETFHGIAAYWGRLFASEFQRASRRG